MGFEWASAENTAVGLESMHIETARQDTANECLLITTTSTLYSVIELSISDALWVAMLHT